MQLLFSLLCHYEGMQIALKCFFSMAIFYMWMWDSGNDSVKVAWASLWFSNERDVFLLDIIPSLRYLSGWCVDTNCLPFMSEAFLSISMKVTQSTCFMGFTSSNSSIICIYLWYCVDMCLKSMVKSTRCIRELIEDILCRFQHVPEGALKYSISWIMLLAF